MIELSVDELNQVAENMKAKTKLICKKLTDEQK